MAKLKYKVNGNWEEVIIPSKTISGVVNQNGTITFTMSDGSTVTTTGESVIGPQGEDYVLTAQDKDDIADIVLAEFTGSIVNGELNTR